MNLNISVIDGANLIKFDYSEGNMSQIFNIFKMVKSFPFFYIK